MDLAKIFRFLKIKIEGDSLKDWDVAGKPVLVLGLNHEAIIEPFVLRKLIKRNDVGIVGIKSYGWLAKRIGWKFLPVMPKKYAIDLPKKQVLKNVLNPIKLAYLLEMMTTSQIEELNNKSIAGAVKIIKGGGMVIIFVRGGNGLLAKKGRGAEIIANTLKDQGVKFETVEVGFSGLTRWGLFLSQILGGRIFVKVNKVSRLSPAGRS